MSPENSEGRAAVTRPEEISHIEQEIKERWECLPPEHQADVLLALLGSASEEAWPASPLERELAIRPRYSESYSDDEIRVDIITDETIPEVSIGIKPDAATGLLAFFKERIVTEEPIYACVEGQRSIFPQPVSIAWGQPIELAWKRKEGTMGRIFRERRRPEEINSFTFLQREDSGLTVVFYWPQMFFDEGVERFESLPASEIAMLEFFFLHPHYMAGRGGFPNGVLVQWAREHGGDPRIRSSEPEVAVTVFK
jgi:hypothetical protein